MKMKYKGQKRFLTRNLKSRIFLFFTVMKKTVFRMRREVSFSILDPREDNLHSSVLTELFSIRKMIRKMEFTIFIFMVRIKENHHISFFQ